MKNTNELISELNQFTGTSKYFYDKLSRIYYTEGINYLAEQEEAYWLINLIGSYQEEIKETFQIWNVRLCENGGAVITCRTDSNKPNIVTQCIEYTDFKLDNFEVYCINNVILLKTEY
ncbi:MAG: hypothetical protein H7836_12935 [Magnetococcus sp. YQC-3]